MSNKKGFTLVEVLIVLMIIAVLAFIALPNYSTMINQGAARSAQNNLVAIYNAEQNFYLSAANGGSYCTSTSTLTCNTLPNINANLGLNIPENVNNNLNDGSFSYACVVSGSSYTCTATNVSNGSFTLTITGQPTQLVLPGGSSCPGASCNPVCNSPAGFNYCPS